MIFILYNPHSARFKKTQKLYKKISKKNDCYMLNLLDIATKEESFIGSLTENDEIIVCGGDGTVNRFLNSIIGLTVKCKIYFFSCGLGNDLRRDFKERKYIDIGSLRETFPIVNVNDSEKYIFVNGVGIGIDAVICKNRKLLSYADKKKSYASIAVKSFKNFRTFNLTVEIDDNKYHFDDAWTVVCNNGRFIGNGMKIAPKAVRNNDELDIVIIHSVTKRKLLLFFPLIYFGLHTLLKKKVSYFKCKHFKAIPDGCGTMQMDGETLDYCEQIEVNV